MSASATLIRGTSPTKIKEEEAIVFVDVDTVVRVDEAEGGGGGGGVSERSSHTTLRSGCHCRILKITLSSLVHRVI